MGGPTPLTGAQRKQRRAARLSTVLLVLAVAAATQQAASAADAVPGELVVVWSAAPADMRAATLAVRAAAAAAVASASPAAAAAAASGEGAAGATAAGGSAAGELDIEAVVALEPSPPAEAAPAAGAAAAAADGGGGGGGGGGLISASLVRLGPGQPQDAAAAVRARLEQLPGVAYVQPNYIYTADQLRLEPGLSGGMRHLLQPKTAKPNGRCGQKANARCGGGQCCSSGNKCSSDPIACRGGCQPDWGTCSPRLAREPLKSGEQALPGMERIQASSSGAGGTGQRAGPSVAAVPAWPPAGPTAQNVTIAIVDSGIAAHPDLNIIGGRNFVTSKGPFSPGPDDYADVAGHGTAVSGVAAARNNGAGVWGVLPGAALFAVKVLGNDQTGTAVDIARALQWIAENGTSLGISVINLSVGGSDSPSDDLLVCQAAEAVSARGMVFVGAAGNAQSDMRASVPAKCSAVIAVTAVALLGQGPYYKVQPATFSNWLSADAPDADKKRTLSAPGYNVQTTGLGSSYVQEDGTSFASPAVAGIAARCFAAGECKLGPGAGAANRALIYAAAAAKSAADRKYRWPKKDGLVVDGKTKRYFGPLAWADYW